MNLLDLAGVQSFYGSAQALFDVSLSVQEGQAVALMGRNGMGKTTTIKAICGMIPVRSGSIIFEGHSVVGQPSHKIARRGIGLVPEGRRIFAGLTVTENLIAAMQPGHWTLERVFSLFPKLGERQSQRAATLSGGEQQMLAIGRALMTNPRLLILDEATEGLAPLVRQEIWDAISRLKSETGMAILTIDKSIKELSQIADHAVILQRGATVWSGRFCDLSQEVTTRYLGI